MKKYEYGILSNNGFFWTFREIKDVKEQRLENNILEYCLNELGAEGWKFSFYDGESQIYILIREY